MKWYETNKVEVKDVKSLALALKKSLRYWLDAHRTFKGWLHREWRGISWDDFEHFCCRDLEELDCWVYSVEVANIHFDLRIEYLLTLANRGTAHYCRHCGFLDIGWLSRCPDCNRRWYKPSKYNIEEYLDMGGPAPVWPDVMLKTLRRCYLRHYKEQIKSTIQLHAEEIENALKALDLRKIDLEALLWCLHIRHLGGVISGDYGELFGLPYELVDRISNEGLEAVLGELK